MSGMTVTASTEAAEFYDIYKMNVVTIPTNLPVQRIDEEDEFYKNTHDKFRAIAKSIKEHADKGQPVLVGTVSIEKSELLSEFLHQEKVKRSEEHTSELQSLMRISYAVFCLQKKKILTLFLFTIYTRYFETLHYHIFSNIYYTT